MDKTTKKGLWSRDLTYSKKRTAERVLRPPARHRPRSMPQKKKTHLDQTKGEMGVDKKLKMRGLAIGPLLEGLCPKNQKHRAGRGGT